MCVQACFGCIASYLSWQAGVTEKIKTPHVGSFSSAATYTLRWDLYSFTLVSTVSHVWPSAYIMPSHNPCRWGKSERWVPCWLMPALRVWSSTAWWSICCSALECIFLRVAPTAFYWIELTVEARNEEAHVTPPSDHLLHNWYSIWVKILELPQLFMHLAGFHPGSVLSPPKHISFPFASRCPASFSGCLHSMWCPSWMAVCHHQTRSLDSGSHQAFYNEMVHCQNMKSPMTPGYFFSKMSTALPTCSTNKSLVKYPSDWCSIGRDVLPLPQTIHFIYEVRDHHSLPMWLLLESLVWAIWPVVGLVSISMEGGLIVEDSYMMGGVEVGGGGKLTGWSEHPVLERCQRCKVVLPVLNYILLLMTIEIDALAEPNPCRAARPVPFPHRLQHPTSLLPSERFLPEWDLVLLWCSLSLKLSSIFAVAAKSRNIIILPIFKWLGDWSQWTLRQDCKLPISYPHQTVLVESNSFPLNECTVPLNVCSNNIFPSL